MATRRTKDAAGDGDVTREKRPPVRRTKAAADAEAMIQATASKDDLAEGWVPATHAEPTAKAHRPRRATAATAGTPASLRRRRRPTREERTAAGKAQRQTVPLEALGAFEAADDGATRSLSSRRRRRPAGVAAAVRHSRMLQSAFGFYRGAPAVMAADLGAGPRTTLDVQLCGDAHLLNFGIYGSPERSLVFDRQRLRRDAPRPVEWEGAPDRQPWWSPRRAQRDQR